MKFSPDETQKLIAATDGGPLRDVIDDACEMLTLRAVLLLKKRRTGLQERRKSLPLGDPEADALVAQIAILGAVIVELAEAP